MWHTYRALTWLATHWMVRLAGEHRSITPTVTGRGRRRIVRVGCDRGERSCGSATQASSTRHRHRSREDECGRGGSVAARRRTAPARTARCLSGPHALVRRSDRCVDPALPRSGLRGGRGGGGAARPCAPRSDPGAARVRAPDRSQGHLRGVRASAHRVESRPRGQHRGRALGCVASTRGRRCGAHGARAHRRVRDRCRHPSGGQSVEHRDVARRIVRRQRGRARRAVRAPRDR